jgi:hypothetical protein
VRATVHPLISETCVRKLLICGLPKIWAYFASARGEAKLTFCEVMSASDSMRCASSIRGPTSRETFGLPARRETRANTRRSRDS